MNDFFGSIPTNILMPLVMMFFIAILPAKKSFERLKGRFPRGDADLRKAIWLRHALPSLGMFVAFLGLVLSSRMEESFWSWMVGFAGLFIAGGLFGLLYIGPLYPLLSELEDAEERANRHSESNSSNQGT